MRRMPRCPGRRQMGKASTPPKVLKAAPCPPSRASRPPGDVAKPQHRAAAVTTTSGPDGIRRPRASPVPRQGSATPGVQAMDRSSRVLMGSFPPPPLSYSFCASQAFLIVTIRSVLYLCASIVRQSPFMTIRGHRRKSEAQTKKRGPRSPSPGPHGIYCRVFHQRFSGQADAGAGRSGDRPAPGRSRGATARPRRRRRPPAPRPQPRTPPR